MSDLDLNLDVLMATFVEEAAEDIAALEAGLLSLETSPDDAEVKSELLRRAHTLKGNASCVGLTSVTAFAHAYEELLERIHENAIQADPAVVTLLLSGIDTFRRLIATPNADGGQRTATRSLRVAAEKLDRMLDLAGEIAIARGRVQQLLGEGSTGFESLIEVERQIDMLQTQLQELIMRARMVPIGPLFQQYARTVRDVAAAHDKEAKLVTLGDDVEIDTSAVEVLRDPLTHMIRNAIDHGVETPSEREAKGKSPVGHITLEAKHDAGNIIIRISDDGAGIDRNAVRTRANTALDTDAELFAHIFASGFSTSEEVTDLSGRGVGMDVVRRAVESLRGSIAVESRENEGTTFTIRLPLTLAVIDGFGVAVDDETYVIPMDHVIECVELPEGASRGATGVLLLRDEIVPFVRLRHHFGLAGQTPARENVLIVQHDGAKAGLAVDALHGARQAVIKPLGGCFREVPGVAGSSILGNGRVALILDTPAILRGLAAGEAG
jgi:two-component system chemotaxis sensor kinase CheA